MMLWPALFITGATAATMAVELFGQSHVEIPVRAAIRILQESTDEELRNGAIFSLSEHSLATIKELQRLEAAGYEPAKALLHRLRTMLK